MKLIRKINELTRLSRHPFVLLMLWVSVTSGAVLIDQFGIKNYYLNMADLVQQFEGADENSLVTYSGPNVFVRGVIKIDAIAHWCVRLEFPTQAGKRYSLQTANSPFAPWQSVRVVFVGDGQPVSWYQHGLDPWKVWRLVEQ